MSAFEHSRWDGFPFSPSQIRTGQKRPDRSVNAPFIPDALVPVANDPGSEPVLPAQTPASMHPAPHKDRPVRGHQGLRLLPLHDFTWDHDAMPPQPRSCPDHTLIEQFLALAGQRLGSNGTVAELAAELHSTTGALDQACMVARGKRAVEVIHDLKLERAAALLRGTNRPTLHITADLGYSSHGHFIRAFVAATGRTLDRFRAQSC